MVCEENIIVSDLLCYLQCKIDTVPKESLVPVISNFYKNDAIIAAREILYRDLPQSLPRAVRHVKKEDNVSTMYDVMQAVLSEGEVDFVCKDLSNIPPLSLKNVDPVVLLRQNANLQDEMVEIKAGYEVVKKQLDELKTSVDDISKTICITNSGPSGTFYSSVVRSGLQNIEKQSLASSPNEMALQQIIDMHSGNDAAAGNPNAGGNSGAVGTTPLDESGRDLREVGTLQDATSSRSGSDVGKHYHVDSDSFMHRKPRQRKPPIIGKSKQSKLRIAVMKKKRDIFVTRLHEDTSSEEIRDFVNHATGDPSATVVRLKNKHPGYASFKVTCDDEHLQLLLSEDTWDDGILVRPFFQAKKSETSSVVAKNK